MRELYRLLILWDVKKMNFITLHNCSTSFKSFRVAHTLRKVHQNLASTFLATSHPTACSCIHFLLDRIRTPMMVILQNT